MKKTYQIEVDCANCANLMEDAAKKTEGVADAVVNFFGSYLGISLEMSWLNAIVSGVLGVPGVVILLLFKYIL